MLPEHLASGSTALYGVIGWPLAQSLSPLLHNTAFRAMRINALYQRWEVPPEHLAAFVEAVRVLHIQGCSVTIPHKKAVLPLLDGVSPMAQRVGAVNTLFWQGDTLCGGNTDVAGFMGPLAQEALAGADVLLLGAGGAARAVAAGLTSLPRDRRPAGIAICTPSDTRHLPLAEEFGLRPIPWAQRHATPARLVVNATPLGMKGKAETETPYHFQTAPPVAQGLAYDLVYNPLRTRFLLEAHAAGRRCISGLDMFLRQGREQLRIWTGRTAGESALRSALQAALAS